MGCGSATMLYPCIESSASIHIQPALLENLRDQIGRRRSVRKYSDRPVEAHKIQTLQNYANQLNNTQNLVKIRYLTDPQPALAPLLINCAKNSQHAFAVQLSPSGSRPHLDCYMGFLGELLVLKIVELGLGSVWLGGDGLTFSQQKVKQILGTEEDCPVLIPFGYAEGEVEVNHRRKTSNKIAPEWPSDLTSELELISKAPSAVNRQPYQIVKTVTGCTVVPNDKEMGSLISHWLDSGIAAAHAMIALGCSELEVGMDGVAVSM